METIKVVKFEKLDCSVKMFNIKIDVKTWEFSLDLGIKVGRQRNYRVESIVGKISYDLRSWLVDGIEEYVKVASDNERGFDYVKTGNVLTKFQLFLKKNGVEFVSGILSTMVFESNNLGGEFSDCPFKLIKYSNGNVTLTLVNVGTKKSRVIIDPDTGEKKVFWSREYVKVGDKTMPAFFSKKNFVRLIEQKYVDVPVYEEPATVLES